MCPRFLRNLRAMLTPMQPFAPARLVSSVLSEPAGLDALLLTLACVLGYFVPCGPCSQLRWTRRSTSACVNLEVHAMERLLLLAFCQSLAARPRQAQRSGYAARLLARSQTSSAALATHASLHYATLANERLRRTFSSSLASLRWRRSRRRITAQPLLPTHGATPTNQFSSKRISVCARPRPPRDLGTKKKGTSSGGSSSLFFGSGDP